MLSPKILGEPVIKIKHLQKSFQIPGTSNRVKALNDIHLCEDSEFFAIRRGELYDTFAFLSIYILI